LLRIDIKYTLKPYRKADEFGENIHLYFVLLNKVERVWSKYPVRVFMHVQINNPILYLYSISFSITYPI